MVCLIILSSCKDNNSKPNDYNDNQISDSEKDLTYRPSEAYVIQCLQKVPCIVEIKAVTEDNDPIGQLNKPGGYTSHVYFAYELVNQDDIYGEDLIDKGTLAGGSIEVYKTKKDAKNRNEYLASFDGSVLTSGSHTVIGTVVVRTSDELTATQQKLLESNIIFALKGEDSKIIAPSKNNDNENSKPSQSSKEKTKENAIRDVENYELSILSVDSNNYLTPEYATVYLLNLGYSDSVACSAVAECDINWRAHARKYVQEEYLTYEAEFGRPASWQSASDIVSSMTLEPGFSYEIANETVMAIDWWEQARKYVKHLSDFYDTFNRVDAKSYLECIAANEAGLKDLLENSGVNWNHHALNMANELWENYRSHEYYKNQTDAFVLSKIREDLSSVYKYTESEIDYAIDNISIQK